MLQEFSGWLVSKQDPFDDGGGDDRLEMAGLVALPDLARPAVVKPMNEIVEIERRDLSASPAPEVALQSTERLAQVPLVGDSSPCPQQAPDRLRGVRHRSRVAETVFVAGPSPD